MREQGEDMTLPYDGAGRYFRKHSHTQTFDSCIIA